VATVEFFYDFSSPYSYLASTQIERVSAGHRLVWRPFLLGALFKAIGGEMVPLLSFPAPKLAYNLKELSRWAEHWGVEFRYASKFPQRTVSALRCVLAVPEERRSALTHALYRVIWALDGDLEDRATIADALRKAGFDADEVLAKTESEEIKNALRVNTDEAVRRGAFGAPTFFVGDLMFWGQDRLDFVRRALEGWVPKNG
jgi:2-hydroxychromene-2-carboxylate isomerase